MSRFRSVVITILGLGMIGLSLKVTGVWSLIMAAFGIWCIAIVVQTWERNDG